MSAYTEANIQSLDWKTHIRLRPGMYIGQLGNGTSPEDGIYILVKELLDNSIDEYIMGYGKRINITHTKHEITIRDYGRGIPLGKLVDCVARINTGGKYDDQAFKKSVGLNGVGTKAVNALSSYFRVQSFRDGKTKMATFQQGVLVEESKIVATTEKNGTEVTFRPDKSIFLDYAFLDELIQQQITHYTYLNTGLTLVLNGQKYMSKKGLWGLLTAKVNPDTYLYPIIHLQGQDIEIALTHHPHQEQYETFVNGQRTTQGGTHLVVLKEAIVKTVRDFYKKNFESSDIRQGLVIAFSIRIQSPIFESQTKIKLGSQHMAPQGVTIRSFVVKFIKKALDNYLHKHPAVVEALHKSIQAAAQERKALSGIKKLANQRAQKARLHNKKLRDCTIHYNTKHKRKQESTLFITEGKSASGSITQTRNVATQAVFSLRGKPLNCFGYTKKIVYENEEFNLLQHTLNIEKGLKNLRYNKIVLATDADVDGMHIRLLLLTYFLQFFPELVTNEHLYILETPLFKVRNTKNTYYCYNEKEKLQTIKKLGKNPEITRFKGLGEISAHEFKHFIGPDMRLTLVNLHTDTFLQELLSFYMGRNTPARQDFIVRNLRTDEQPHENPISWEKKT